MPSPNHENVNRFPFQYDRPQRIQHVAGNPLAMHLVPSSRCGCSNGMHRVFAATLVADVSASPSSPRLVRLSSRLFSLTHSSQSLCSPPHQGVSTRLCSSRFGTKSFHSVTLTR